ncbi:PP2C family serine/threonine-protein phosphatase [Actinoplanes sp. NPDC051411]|uniref:PP2C family serine/threonine-protein phosphatase n=1 Tax=Actinoplanes sp. NPDC051411 TaxID=3155522 RepID=UPI0034447EC1
MWKIIGGSVAGTSHTRVGKGCEDAHAWRLGSGIVCAAVADGAGSKPMSAAGSAIAVETVRELAGNLTGCDPVPPPEQWLRAVFDEVHRRIASEAGGRERDRRDFATTLAIAVIIGDTLGIAQIGDTVVVAGGPAGYETIDPDAHDEYANETVFVTHHDFADRIRLTTRPAPTVDELFLSTDGLRYKILDNLAESKPYTPFFTDVAAYARTPSATSDAIVKFLDGVDDQTGDDLTLVVAVREAEGG